MSILAGSSDASILKIVRSILGLRWVGTDPKRAFSLLFNFCKLWENLKTAEFLNVIIANNSPQRDFEFNLKKVKFCRPIHDISG